MKNLILIALATLTITPNALADGFVCQANDGSLNVKVYNNTQAAKGTRLAHIMIFSDPSVSAGRKTIATFNAEQERLTSYGASYAADVDLRFSGAKAKGEYIGGTRLGYVDVIFLDVDFSYGSPVAAGTELDADLRIVKRNGDQITLPMTCVRYLKK